MSMFREVTKAELNPEYFGVGQKLKADCDYLLVGGIGGTCVMLMNLNTMVMLPGMVEVESINQLSREEAREVCELTRLNWTFSDFDFDTRGIKCS